MLQFRLNSGGTGSPTSAATHTLTLSEEYDEIQKANLLPIARQEEVVSDLHSVTSRTSIGMSSGSGRSGGGRGGAASNSEVEELRAQVESLKQQLSERDSTVNELQRQIQTDKRNHDKLQTRWDLFFGGSTSAGGSGDSASPSNRSTSPTPSSTPVSTPRGMSTRRLQSASGDHHMPGDSSTLTQTEMMRLNKHMDQLEADKDACVQKTVKLSVALAESKARVSTLEAQLEEMQSIILLQNSAPIGFSRVTPMKSQTNTPCHSTHGTKPIGSSSIHSTKKPTTTAAPAGGGGGGAARRRASVSAMPPPMDSFLPITDIQLNDDSMMTATSGNGSGHFVGEGQQVTISLDEDVDINDATAAMADCNDSACLSLESESLGWSGRPLSYLSERSGRSQRSHNGGGQNAATASSTTAAAAAGGGNRFSSGLREFRNMISKRDVKPGQQQQLPENN